MGVANRMSAKSGLDEGRRRVYACRVSYAYATTYVDTSEYGPDSNVV